MNTERRLEIYLRGVKNRIDGDGHYRITFKQRRRLQHKENRHARRGREFAAAYKEAISTKSRAQNDHK